MTFYYIGDLVLVVSFVVSANVKKGSRFSCQNCLFILVCVISETMVPTQDKLGTLWLKIKQHLEQSKSFCPPRDSPSVTSVRECSEDWSTDQFTSPQETLWEPIKWAEYGAPPRGFHSAWGRAQLCASSKHSREFRSGGPNMILWESQVWGILETLRQHVLNSFISPSAFMWLFSHICLAKSLGISELWLDVPALLFWAKQFLRLALFSLWHATTINYSKLIFKIVFLKILFFSDYESLMNLLWNLR